MSKKTIPLWRFLKTLPDIIKHIKKTNHGFDSANLYFQDESRYGLKLRPKRILTCKGVKPIQPYQHRFQNTYLYGAFSPIDGNKFLLDLPNCNTEMMQLFLDHFSKQNPNELKITVVDNASFHRSKSLTIPVNVVLLFIPPYSPELNPAERVWQYLKDNVTHKVFETMDLLQEEMHQAIRNLLSVDRVKSLTGYPMFINALIK